MFDILLWCDDDPPVHYALFSFPLPNSDVSAFGWVHHFRCLPPGRRCFDARWLFAAKITINVSDPVIEIGSVDTSFKGGGNFRVLQEWRNYWEGNFATVTWQPIMNRLVKRTGLYTKKLVSSRNWNIFFLSFFSVFNQVIPSMNPQELSTMVWMGQFASPLDENLTNMYGQPVPAVMDDIAQPTPSMVRILLPSVQEFKCVRVCAL